MDACSRLGVQRFAINTHHLAGAWQEFGEPTGLLDATQGDNGEPVTRRRWHGREVALFHETVLLETGGGLKNIQPWIADEPLLIHNADIFSNIPLEKLAAAHGASGLPVTLALRSAGVAKHVALDVTQSRVTDIRGRLGIAAGTHVFSGIYCINPEFLEWLPRHEKISVIPAFLELAKRGALGATIIDEGSWLDLGDREAYLRAHRELALAPAIHPEAVIDDGALIEDSIIGPGAVVASGAVVKKSILWPGSRIAATALLESCIVCSGSLIEGQHQDQDV